MKNKGLKGIFNNVAKNVRVVLVGNLEVKTSFILDKKDPTNLDKAYLLVLTRDIISNDKRWRFAYRSKKNSIQLLSYTSIDFSDIVPKRIVKYSLGMAYGTDEYKRFDKFISSKGIYYKNARDSFKEASIKATIKYLNIINRRDLAHLV